MNQRERMLAGLPYKGSLDGLREERMETRLKIYDYNLLRPNETEKMDELIRDILGKTDEKITVKQPFNCDYGKNIQVGNNFFANYNCTILDIGRVIIGENVRVAPNVSIYTAGHPIHPLSRNSGYEYGIEVIIGDNVWLGGSVVINPGVKIGNNVVIGSGSVVTKDIPDNVIAAGNPCKVIREITEEDRKYHYKDKEFDIQDY
ncbi:sugar O-acetyltransferase [uncultured Clostridium sp.]|uniref:sugar O-acetyltransferase n=1 Tax=uncultured Clostridium sp. TaxID=59620 RepID=UPI0028EB80E2|nr:sugar O-acetyltransferase [uncultured Clostridium sp.]